MSGPDPGDTPLPRPGGVPAPGAGEKADRNADGGRGAAGGRGADDATDSGFGASGAPVAAGGPTADRGPGADGSVRLSAHRYGKSGIRLATVTRDGDRHTFTDLDIEVWLDGAFDAAYVEGDNRDVVPTDTMRGTCYALARQHGVTPLTTFGRKLVDRFLATSPACTRAEVRLAALPWERADVDGAPHPHTFRPAAGGTPIITVARARDGAPVVTGGVRGLRVLKTTGSAFSGFPRDEYTVLPETRDRIMATTVQARWGYLDPVVVAPVAGDADAQADGDARADGDAAADGEAEANAVADVDAELDAVTAAVPATMTARFATHDDSESVQHTLWEMGRAVLAAHPQVAWIRFRMPNEHHILADLEPYGFDNPNHVFVVTDRPFGVIEGEVARDGVTPEPGW